MRKHIKTLCNLFEFEFVNEMQEEDGSTSSLLQVVSGGKQPLFPNVDITLQLFLALPVSNTSGESFFSKGVGGGYLYPALVTGLLCLHRLEGF